MTTITMQSNGLTPFKIGVPVLPAWEPLEVTLEDRGLWRLEGDHRWQVVICLEGSVWITQENDVQDYLLTAGQPVEYLRAEMTLRIQRRPAWSDDMSRV